MADTPDVHKALDEIRREVIESRNMTIKTDNALKTLHAELKHVASGQEEFQKRTWFASGITYLGFLGLAIGAAVAVSSARVASVATERDQLTDKVKTLSDEMAAQQAERSAQATAERAAADVYRMMTTLPGEERLKGVDALAKLDQSRLSPFSRQALGDRAALLRKEVGAGMLERGRAAFRRQDWPAATTELGRFLAMDNESEDAIEASFFLGNAYFQQKQYANAEKHLTRFVEGDKRAKQRDFALLLLVQSCDLTGQKDRAQELAREAVNSYPGSEYRTYFSNRARRAETSAAPAEPAAVEKPAAPPAPRAAPPAPATTTAAAPKPAPAVAAPKPAVAPPAPPKPSPL